MRFKSPGKRGIKKHGATRTNPLRLKKMMQPQAVKYVLMAHDMERAVAFYRDAIGFSVDFVSPEWSELRFGDAILGLHGGGDGSRRPTGLSIQYEDVARAYSAAVESGATGLVPPEKREGEPILLASIADPEGNLVMLTQYVGHE